MNKLDTAIRVRILSMLVKGSSMRSTSRISGVSINTVTKLLVDAGRACAAYHYDNVRDVRAKRVNFNEIWSFVAAKHRSVKTMKTPAEGAGDAWTWTAIDADSKLIISYLVGGRDGGYAYEFMQGAAERLASRVQFTTDGHRSYLEAVEGAFGLEVDCAMLDKMYGTSPESAKGRHSPAECICATKQPIVSRPSDAHISTSYVERQNLTMRMAMRRFSRLTNTFSKKVDNHIHMLSLYFVHWNFCRVHKTLRMSPAMAAGIDNVLHDMEWVVGLIDANAPAPSKRGPYKQTVQISN
jgi:IS1 family transposase